MTFYDGEQKINNTGWIRNGDEREEWNEAKPKGNAERFSNLHFLDQQWSRDLEFCTCKTERTLQISGKCVQNTVMSTDSTVLFCAQKARQKNQCNEASRPLKSSALSQHIKYGEVSLQFEFYYTAAKTTTSLWNEMKGKTRKMQSD